MLYLNKIEVGLMIDYPMMTTTIKDDILIVHHPSYSYKVTVENVFKMYRIAVIDSFTDDAQKIGKLTPEENANVYYGIIDMYNYYKGLTEDIKKTKSGKWVNVGKEGTHGEFKTKKAAREQQKAMFARGFKESIKPTNAEKIYDKLQKDLNKLGYQIGLNRRTGDIQINQRVFKENGKYKSGTITTREALKDAIDLANEYGLKTSVEVFLHKPILTIHTTELFNPEVTREALNNNLKVKDESFSSDKLKDHLKESFKVVDKKIILNLNPLCFRIASSPYL